MLYIFIHLDFVKCSIFVMYNCSGKMSIGRLGVEKGVLKIEF